MEFCFPRPKGHSGKRGLKPSAPTKHTQKPDIDKCVRVVLDALTSVAYADDAQVVQVHARKGWATDAGPGVRVRVLTSVEDVGRFAGEVA